MNPFIRQHRLFEAKARLSATIGELTSKGKKYVKFADLKSKLGLDDDSFNGLMADAKKANRHSNRYIFTSVDDEDAVGITALKRNESETSPASSPGYGLAHRVPNKVDDEDQGQTNKKKKDDWSASDPGPIPATYMVKEHRKSELWNIWAKESWRGLDKRGLLPEGWHKMSGTEIVESIIDSEFRNTPSVVDVNRVLDLFQNRLKRIGYALNYSERNPSVGDSHRAVKQQYHIGGDLVLQFFLDVDDQWNWKIMFELLDKNGESLAMDKLSANTKIPNDVLATAESWMAQLMRNPSVSRTF
jgi:hypothetical protein